MKKRFLSAFLLFVLLVIPATASAAEMTKGLMPSGDVREVGGLHVCAIPESAMEVSEEPVSQIPDGNENDIMPCFNTTGVTRLTPRGVVVFPIAKYQGENIIVTDDVVKFYSPSLYFQNYIRDNMSREKQTEITNFLAQYGAEQIGWYMITGYDLDTYKPGRFTYYEWTNTGKSGAKTKAAVDGADNIFELVSYFSNGSANSFKFGITGNVTYQTHPTSTSMVTMPIELSVTID